MEKPFNFYPKDPSLDVSNKKMQPLGLENLMKTLMLGPQPATVVGIVGKSNCGKSEILNSILDRQVFEALELEDPYDGPQNQWSRSSNNQCCIEFYNDVSTNTIYLDLISLGDHSIFSNICRSVAPNMSETEFHIWLEKQEYHHLKALLFLFLCCNAILIVHSDHVFDVSYLHMLRILVPIKQLVYSNILSYLSSIFDPNELNFASNFLPGRCCPSVAFVFNDVYYI